VVDGFPEVADSLVVHIEDQAGEGIGMGELLLFIVPAAGLEVDDGLKARIAGELRRSLSPRHVPDAIHGVPGIPRTLSGKKLEVPRETHPHRNADRRRGEPGSAGQPGFARRLRAFGGRASDPLTRLRAWVWRSLARIRRESVLEP